MPQQTDRTIYVGSVGKEVDEPALLALFGHCGTVTQIRIAGDPSYDTRYAFIEFTDPAEAQVALLLDGMAVFDRTIKVSMARGGAGPGVVRSNDPDRVQRTVHVGGLPMEELSEAVLADFFQNVGEVLAVRKSGRFAWVEFTSIQAAHQALTLDGELLGANMLKISQSKTPIHTAGWRAPPRGHQASRSDLVSLAAQRIHQPMSPTLLGHGPMLGSAFGQSQFSPYGQPLLPPYRPEYPPQLQPASLPYAYSQQHPTGFEQSQYEQNMAPHYLGQTKAAVQQLALNATLPDMSGVAGASAQSLPLPSIPQYGQHTDLLTHRPLQSQQPLDPSHSEVFYSQGFTLPGNAGFPYSQPYPTMPAGGSFFS